MPPGRPRIHHTKEQVMQANRDKNKRHYDGHRDEINKKHKRKRLELKKRTNQKSVETEVKKGSNRATHPNTPHVHSGASCASLRLLEELAQSEDQIAIPDIPSQESSISHAEKKCLNRLENAIEGITELEEEFIKLTKNKSDFLYLSGLCTHFEDNSEKDLRAALDVFEYHLASCTRIKNTAHDHGNVVAEEIGCCEDLTRAYALTKRLEALIVELDDLAHSSLLGPAAFAVEYQRSELAFQRVHQLM